ncbi:MAG: hypothetical protein MUF87_05770 [Anaerolineae bacterium]|jgi:hypothetical protein|nr:hypothetical protein [Anaerolineae bacterium]
MTQEVLKPKITTETAKVSGMFNVRMIISITVTLSLLLLIFFSLQTNTQTPSMIAPEVNQPIAPPINSVDRVNEIRFVFMVSQSVNMDTDKIDPDPMFRSSALARNIQYLADLQSFFNQEGANIGLSFGVIYFNEQPTTLTFDLQNGRRDVPWISLRDLDLAQNIPNIVQEVESSCNILFCNTQGANYQRATQAALTLLNDHLTGNPHYDNLIYISDGLACGEFSPCSNVSWDLSAIHRHLEGVAGDLQGVDVQRYLLVAGDVYSTYFQDSWLQIVQYRDHQLHFQPPTQRGFDERLSPVLTHLIDRIVDASPYLPTNIQYLAFNSDSRLDTFDNSYQFPLLLKQLSVFSSMDLLIHPVEKANERFLMTPTSFAFFKRDFDLPEPYRVIIGAINSPNVNNVSTSSYGGVYVALEAVKADVFLMPHATYNAQNLGVWQSVTNFYQYEEIKAIVKFTPIPTVPSAANFSISMAACRTSASNQCQSEILRLDPTASWYETLFYPLYHDLTQLNFQLMAADGIQIALPNVTAPLSLTQLNYTGLNCPTPARNGSFYPGDSWNISIGLNIAGSPTNLTPLQSQINLNWNFTRNGVPQTSLVSLVSAQGWNYSYNETNNMTSGSVNFAINPSFPNGNLLNLSVTTQCTLMVRDVANIVTPILGQPTAFPFNSPTGMPIKFVVLDLDDANWVSSNNIPLVIVVTDANGHQVGRYIVPYQFSQSTQVGTIEFNFDLMNSSQVLLTPSTYTLSYSLDLASKGFTNLQPNTLGITIR